jgi:thiol-disulfide isomerase/thioredoxin
MLVLAGLTLASSVFALQEPKDISSYKARDIRRSGVWINGAPLSLKSLRGRVVVLDFWAFDCEPCLEAMPHITSLYDRYSAAGLVIIGVHTPRADYERDVSRLRDAVTRLGIMFPVVMDDKQKIFRDYRCDLWPSQFVVDGNGIVRYSHGGVGRYSEMEDVIRKLLNM